MSRFPLSPRTNEIVMETPQHLSFTATFIKGQLVGSVWAFAVVKALRGVVTSGSQPQMPPQDPGLSVRQRAVLSNVSNAG